MQLRVAALIAFICLCTQACSDNKSYTIATGPLASSSKIVGDEMVLLLRRDAGIDLQALNAPNLSSDVNCAKLLSHEVDFALVQNVVPDGDALHDTTARSHDLRSVLPIYPDVLFIIAKEDIVATGLADLLRGRRVGFGPQSGTPSRFAHRLLSSLGIDTTSFTPVYTARKDNFIGDSIDVSFHFTGFTNPTVNEMLLRRHGRLFGLDDVSRAFRGSVVDGFCLHYEQARPYIIPKSTFGNLPEQPVLTLAIDNVLVTRTDVDKYLVHEVVRSLLENKQELVNSDPLFGAMGESFATFNLNFPLHKGTRMYLDRNLPSMWERYSHLGSPIVALVLALIGAFSSLRQWRRNKRRDRIDKYYERIIAVEEEMNDIATLADCAKAYDKIKVLKREAFDHLIEGRLAADESFKIFVALADEAAAMVDRRRQELKG